MLLYEGYTLTECFGHFVPDTKNKVAYFPGSAAFVSPPLERGSIDEIL